MREHDEVAGEQRNDDRGILAALRFVDRGRVRERELVERRAVVGDLTWLESFSVGEANDELSSSSSTDATMPTSPFQTFLS